MPISENTIKLILNNTEVYAMHRDFLMTDDLLQMGGKIKIYYNPMIFLIGTY